MLATYKEKADYTVLVCGASYRPFIHVPAERLEELQAGIRKGRIPLPRPAAGSAITELSHKTG